MLERLSSSVSDEEEEQRGEESVELDRAESVGGLNFRVFITVFQAPR